MSRREERSLLDLIRWISAFMVAAGHLWAAVAPKEPGLFNRAVWAMADTRHSWVIVFFVLSGYLVGGGVLARADRFDVKTYALARFSRIYIVLIPALALTAGLDGLAHSLQPQSPIYSAVWRDGLFGATPPFARYTLREILASLLSLETVVSQPIGSNGPLWSLGFEWVFYFCLPPLMLLADALGRLMGDRRWLARALVAVSSVILLAAAKMPYAGLLWLIWLGGALAQGIAETGRWPMGLRRLGGLVCLAGFVLAFKINYRFADAFIGFGLASVLARFPPGERGLNPRLDRVLASGSYSLYVTHLPIMAFLCMLFYQHGWLTRTGAASSLTLVAMLGLATLLVITVSILSYWLFERRTEALRQWLRGPKPPDPPVRRSALKTAPAIRPDRRKSRALARQPQALEPKARPSAGG